MRNILESLSGWLKRRGKQRVIADHLNPSIDYLIRNYLYGGERDGNGKLIHRRFEACLHQILVSDNDHLHNHPAAYFSLILAGSYIEHTPSGSYVRRPGHMRVRSKRSLHRLEIVNGPVWTLFLFLEREGKESEWDFLIDGKLVPHDEHLHLAELQ